MNQSFGLPLVNLAGDGELRTSTEAIARGYGSAHASVIKLVRKYSESLKQWGIIGFEIRLNPQGRPTEFATLNERQAGFLVSLMRNTQEVVEFKARLITEFANMAEALHNRDLTMFEKRLRLEAKDQTSFAKASMGSKLMLVRRAEKPAIKKEIQALESEMNQRLFH